MIRLKCLFAMVSFMLAGPFLFSQETAPGAEESTVRFIGLDQGYQNLLYENGRDTVEISVPSRRFSPIYPMPAGGTLELYRLSVPPVGSPPGTQAVREVMARVALPKGVQKVLVFLIAAPAGSETPLRGVAVNAESDKHTNGTGRLFNLSTYRTGLSFDGVPVIAGPRTIDTIVPFEPGVHKIIIAVEKNGEWQSAVLMLRRLSPFTKIYAVLIDRKPTDDNPLPVDAFVFFEFDRKAAVMAAGK